MRHTNDLDKYPIYAYDWQLRRLVRLPKPYSWTSEWEMHHFVKRQIIKRHPELESIQKLIFLPTRIKINGVEHNMHAEADHFHSKFEELYGIPLSSVIYGGKDEV